MLGVSLCRYFTQLQTVLVLKVFACVSAEFYVTWLGHIESSSSRTRNNLTMAHPTGSGCHSVTGAHFLRHPLYDLLHAKLVDVTDWKFGIHPLA